MLRLYTRGYFVLPNIPLKHLGQYMLLYLVGIFYNLLVRYIYILLLLGLSAFKLANSYTRL